MGARHDSVAHAWANDTTRARRGFNMFWEGDGAGRVIFSYGYHFPIARFVAAEDGGTVVLFTTDSYSVSTQGHKTLTRRAIPPGVPVFDVPDVMAETDSAHRANHESMVEEMRQCLAKAARARVHGASWLGQAERLGRQTNEYAAAFGLEVERVEAAELSPEALERIRAAEAEKRARERERTREAMERWKSGASDRPPHTSRPALRVRGEMLETSWGIRVPLREALPVFRLALRCAAAGREFVPDPPIYVGSWPIDRITEEGTVHAGCHVLTMQAQQSAAIQAGISFGEGHEAEDAA